MVLHAKLISDAFRIGIRAFTRYNRYESKVFDSAYRGFPRSVRRGARHGYIGGTIIGSLISQDDVETENGFPEIFSPYVEKTNKFKETYSRYPRRSRPRCPTDFNFSRRKRR